MPSRRADELSPGDEFWRKIKAGEKFTQQEVQDGYSIGRRGATRTSTGMAGTAPIVGAQAAIKDTGWREKIAGFDGYRTVGVAVEDGSFVMGVIPESLFKGTSLQAIDRTAVVRYRFVPVGGSFRLDVLDADYRSLAIQELAANNELKTTRQHEKDGDFHQGRAVSKLCLSMLGIVEACPRFVLMMLAPLRASS